MRENPSLQQEKPQVEMIHAFQNPGTADHVQNELGQARDFLYAERSAVQEEFAEGQRQFEAVHRDLTDRIDMLEAAIEMHSKKKPLAVESRDVDAPYHR